MKRRFNQIGITTLDDPRWVIAAETEQLGNADRRLALHRYLAWLPVDRIKVKRTNPVLGRQLRRERALTRASVSNYRDSHALPRGVLIIRGGGWRAACTSGRRDRPGRWIRKLVRPISHARQRSYPGTPTPELPIPELPLHPELYPSSRIVF